MDIDNFLDDVQANISGKTQSKSITPFIIGSTFSDLAYLTKETIETGFLNLNSPEPQIGDVNLGGAFSIYAGSELKSVLHPGGGLNLYNNDSTLTLQAGGGIFYEDSSDSGFSLFGGELDLRTSNYSILLNSNVLSVNSNATGEGFQLSKHGISNKDNNTSRSLLIHTGSTGTTVNYFPDTAGPLVSLYDLDGEPVNCTFAVETVIPDIELTYQIKCYSSLNNHLATFTGNLDTINTHTLPSKTSYVKITNTNLNTDDVLGFFFYSDEFGYNMTKYGNRIVINKEQLLNQNWLISMPQPS